MSKETKLAIEQRLEAQEAKMEALSVGLNAILIDFAKIDEAKEVQESRPWDPDKIKFVGAQGAKGPYEKADPQATPDFKAMLQDLKDHKGKFRHGQYFYWVFSDSATVGRKKKG